VAYDLSRLGERRFEDLCRAIAKPGKVVRHIGIMAFGDGPDGGREASFDGSVDFPGAAGGPSPSESATRSADSSVRSIGQWFLVR